MIAFEERVSVAKHSIRLLMIEEKVTDAPETRCGKSIVLGEGTGLGFAVNWVTLRKICEASFFDKLTFRY